MKIKIRVIRLLLTVMIGIIVSDLSYTGAQVIHNESTSFIIEAGTHSSSSDIAEGVVPNLAKFFITLFAEHKLQSHTESAEKIVVTNLSPHGWHVPVYIDDRMLII